MDKHEKSESLGFQDICDVLQHLHERYRVNIDKIPLEEKKAHHAMLRKIIESVSEMEKMLAASLSATDLTDRENMVLRLCDPRVNAARSFAVSSNEQMSSVLNHAINSKVSSSKKPEPPMTVSVTAIVKEENFNFLSCGPKSPNYLLQVQEVYVVFQTVEQAEYVRTHLNNPSFAGAHFVKPLHDTKTRRVYREIGTLITRLEKVDAKLKSLGAVPGKGGLPELSKMLVDEEEFDKAVEAYKETPELKPVLHSFLCSRTRVNKRKRQEILEPLVEERIEILLSLSRFDQDQFPFEMERAFK